MIYFLIDITLLINKLSLRLHGEEKIIYDLPSKCENIQQN